MSDSDTLKHKLVAVMLCTMIVGLAGPARAASLVQQEFGRWKLGDKCIADAITAFPDRDADSQRKRDQFVDKCLEKNNLPPRAHVAPEAGDQQVPVATSR